MCAVSMVVEYYGRQNSPLNPLNPLPVIQPIVQWDLEAKELLREALRKLDQLDKRLGDLECNDLSKQKLKGIIGDWE